MKLLGFVKSRSGRITGNAISQLVEQQLPDLYRIALGMTGQPSDAEDLVHDSCVKALVAAESVQFESQNQLTNWLRQILVNTYRDIYRRAQRSPLRPSVNHATSDPLDNVVELVESTAPTPLESLESDQSTVAIQQTLSAMPPEVRVVTVLFLISGLAYRDIASITDCPIGTVMSRLARGRKMLRQHLADHVDDEAVKTPGVSANGDDQA